jgi:hypothetical protein
MSSLPYVAPFHMGQLTINPSGSASGVKETPMRDRAWWITDMSPLYGFPAQKGDNLDIGGIDGRRAYLPLNDQTTIVMPLYVQGQVNRNGTPNGTSALQGLISNLADLKLNVHDTFAGGATRAAKLVWPDGTVQTADVQCRIEILRQSAANAWCTFFLTIPDGWWT